MMTPATSSFAAPSLAERVVARGAPGDPVNVITKLIWSINPHNTVLLESEDGTERVVWDDGTKHYLHQVASCGKAIWTTQSAWRKNEAYNALKNSTHWVVPHLENHQDLAGNDLIADATDVETNQTGQIGQNSKDVESSLAHEQDVLVVDSTGNRSEDACKSMAAGAYPRTGAMIALLPAENELDRIIFPGGESRDDLHLTLLYLGTADMISEEIKDYIVECVIKCVDTMPTVIGNGFAIDWFNPTGPDPCIVLGLSGEQLVTTHHRVLRDVNDVLMTHGLTMHKQHVPWIPHITLKYSDEQEPLSQEYINNLFGPVTFNRVRVAFGDDVYDIPLGDTIRSEERTDDTTASAWDGILTFDENGDPVVPNALIPLEAFQERDVNVPSGPGHSLRDYWTRGAGAARIRWGTEGSFKRCVRFLSEYVRDPEGLCAEYHNIATGEYPRGGNVPSEGETVVMNDDVLYDSPMSDSSVHVAADTDICPDGYVMVNGNCMSKGDVSPSVISSDTYELREDDDRATMVNGAAPWEGVLTVEGVESGDSRMFSPNALTWDEPPLPLMWQKVTSHGGTGDVSVRVGSIDRIWRMPDPSGRTDVYNIMGEGTIDLGNPDGQEVYRRMRRGYMRGNSVDVDSVKDSDVEFMFPTANGNEGGADDIFARPEMTVFKRGRIRATTLVEIPAFTEARLSLKDGITADASVNDTDVIVTNTELDDDITSAAAPRHRTDVVDKPWNASENLRRLPTPMPVSTGRSMFGWIQSDAINDGTMPKYAGRFPHHEVSADGDPGAANLTALSGTIGALNGARGGAAISDAERRATYNHVAAHMRDANVEPPPLKSFEAYTMSLTSSAVPRHDTPTATGTWDSGVIMRRLASPMSIEDARNVFAWIDMDRVEDGMMPKGAGKLPHHDVSADGTPGAANLTAVSAAIGALNGARGGVDIPPADRQATYNHLAQHLRDADREPPPLLSAEAAHVEALVAATSIIKISDAPPRAWFNEPTDVTPMGALTVTDEGRVYGYIAPANVRHRSFADRAQYVPMKKVDYDRFMGGETIVEDGGRVATGNITMNCGHATTAVNLTAKQAADHYDNTCSIVATVRVGENRDGVWVAGALLPGVSADQIRRMMACRLSGDWRSHLDRPGWREFVAALLVPVPGFPMARQRSSVSLENGELVASSVPVNLSIHEFDNDDNETLSTVMSDEPVTLDTTLDIESGTIVIVDDCDDVNLNDSVGSEVNMSVTDNTLVDVPSNDDNESRAAFRDELRQRALASRQRIRALRLEHAKAMRANAMPGTAHVDIMMSNADKVEQLRARINKEK